MKSDFKMGKTKNDEVYERAVKDGKEGGLLDDAIRGVVGNSLNTTKRDEIYDKGYSYGAEHRNDSSSGDSSKSDDKQSSDKDSGSKSGCYLTTACAEAIRLPDNCLELSVLRNFRDKILMPQSFGKRAVKEYYKIAPEIVQAIGEQDNTRRIWSSIYRDIEYAVSLVLSGNFERAFKHYQQMTSKLKERYLD